MSELAVQIPAGAISLEAMYDDGKGMEGAVLCHPHPLYGGSMDNNVVFALQRILRSLGRATLRFNFRGVGLSGGEYANGEGEIEDVLAAVAHLRKQGKDVVHLIGYSFGAWVLLKSVMQGLKPSSLTLVSPPLDFLPFGDLLLPLGPCLVVMGDSDQFCTVESLKKWLHNQSLSGRVRIVPEIISHCDHFYVERESALTARVEEFMKKIV